jgi:hypothetical protein
MSSLAPLYDSKRGIAPQALLELVKNTAAFSLKDNSLPYTKPLVSYEQQHPSRLSHFEYFEFCLGAHYTTVATFVPTDVDNQIRKNLWEVECESVLLAMAELTLSSLSWPFRPVTSRWQAGANPDEDVSGHHGEWFSVAVGAYCALTKAGLPFGEKLREAIEAEWARESRIFQHLCENRDGIGALRACTLLAHNLGDLDRVQDQWKLPDDDPLRKTSYKLGHEISREPWLKKAGSLNKALMASENHRHYPLRSVKGLRSHSELLLPIGPFLYQWGKTVASSPFMEERTLKETVEALMEGFRRLSSPNVPLYGYARALRGISETGMGRRVIEELSARARKDWQKGPLADCLMVPEERFRESWAKKALQFLEGL